jgi:hypothetical protein
MKAIAWAYNDALGYALPGVESIARTVDMSEGHCRRLIAGLVAKHRLRRYAALRANDRSTTSNNYEIVGYAPEVPSADRKAAEAKLFVPRQRAEVQVFVRRGGRQRKQLQLQLVEDLALAEVRGDSVTGLMEVHGPEGAELAEVRCSEDGSAGCVFAVENVLECLPPTNIRCLPPTNIRCLPIDTLFEEREESKTPQSPLFASTGEQNCLDMAKARTTASAKANATTSSTEAERGSMERGASAGMSSGAVGARGPRALRWRQEPGRCGLDGEAGALQLEVDRVMRECGFTPGPLARVIGEQLALRMERAACCAVVAGDLMIQRWHSYVEDLPLMIYPFSPKKLFREGLWLTPAAWPYDRRKMAELKRYCGSQIGMHRPRA